MEARTIFCFNMYLNQDRYIIYANCIKLPAGLLEDASVSSTGNTAVVAV